MSKGIYFDNAAGTLVSGSVASFYMSKLADTPGNQEAIHRAGYDARELIDSCAKELAKALSLNSNSVCFAHTGTEAFNVISAIPGLNNGHVITTALEHPALLSSLTRSGAKIDFVNLCQGQVDHEDLQNKLRPDTKLVAVFHVQSEVGLISDFSWVKLVRAQSPKAIILADTIQSITKMELPDVDICLLSGHKLGAPGGAAIFYNSSHRELKSFFSTVRSPNYLCGRVEAPLISALTCAAVQHAIHRSRHDASMRAINNMLRQELLKMQTRSGQNIILTIPEQQSSSYILHFIAPGLQSAVLLRMLSAKSIYVSSGSACQSETDHPSTVLKELGLANYGFSGIRISFGVESTRTEASIFLEELQKILLNY